MLMNFNQMIILQALLKLKNLTEEELDALITSRGEEIVQIESDYGVVEIKVKE